jgi:hypothetical protein
MLTFPARSFRNFFSLSAGVEFTISMGAIPFQIDSRTARTSRNG